MGASSIVHTNNANGIRTIGLIGRLDLEGAEGVEAAMAKLTSEQGLRVVVDITRVSFLASAGIRILIIAARAVKQNGGDLVLVLGNNQQVRETLEFTGITMMIPSFESGDQAEQKLLS
jgi:anti-anti-sigma factor